MSVHLARWRAPAGVGSAEDSGEEEDDEEEEDSEEEARAVVRRRGRRVRRMVGGVLVLIFLFFFLEMDWTSFHNRKCNLAIGILLDNGVGYLACKRKREGIQTKATTNPNSGAPQLFYPKLTPSS